MKLLKIAAVGFFLGISFAMALAAAMQPYNFQTFSVIGLSSAGVVAGIQLIAAVRGGLDNALDVADLGNAANRQRLQSLLDHYRVTGSAYIRHGRVVPAVPLSRVPALAGNIVACVQALRERSHLAQPDVQVMSKASPEGCYTVSLLGLTIDEIEQAGELIAEMYAEARER